MFESSGDVADQLGLGVPLGHRALGQQQSRPSPRLPLFQHIFSLLPSSSRICSTAPLSYMYSMKKSGFR